MNSLQPLQRGRHKLPAEQVEESQRDRLCIAAISVCHEHGYTATTIARITATARVSRKTFYELFDNKEECFDAACQFALDHLAADMGRAISSSTDTWEQMVTTGVHQYLTTLTQHPEAAHFVTVATATIPHLTPRRAQFLELFVAGLISTHAYARQRDQSLHEVPDEMFRVLVAGVDGCVRDHIRLNGTTDLLSLAPLLERVTLAIGRG